MVSFNKRGVFPPITGRELPRGLGVPFFPLGEFPYIGGPPLFGGSSQCVKGPDFFVFFPILRGTRDTGTKVLNRPQVTCGSKTYGSPPEGRWQDRQIWGATPRWEQIHHRGGNRVMHQNPWSPNRWNGITRKGVFSLSPRLTPLSLAERKKRREDENESSKRREDGKKKKRDGHGARGWVPEESAGQEEGTRRSTSDDGAPSPRRQNKDEAARQQSR